jgi:ATP-dependent Lon protease
MKKTGKISSNTKRKNSKSNIRPFSTCDKKRRPKFINELKPDVQMSQNDYVEEALKITQEKVRKVIQELNEPLPSDEFDNLDTDETTMESLLEMLDDHLNNSKLCYICGTFHGIDCLLDLKRLKVEIEGKEEIINYDDETLFYKTALHEDELLHLLVNRHSTYTYAKAVCDDEFYSMFSLFTDIESKYNAIKDFLSLSKAQQQSIINQSNGEKYEVVPAKETATNSRVDFLRFKYSLCKNTYSKQQQLEIDDMLDQKNMFRKKTDRKLQYILNISPNAPARKNVTYKKIMRTLDDHLYKMNNVKERIAECMISSKYSQHRGLRLLIVGNPGTGKTTIAQTIAQLYGIPFEIINLNGVSSALDLKGTDPSYEGSDIGKFVRCFYNHGTSEMVLVLDEIDKLGTGDKEGNPADSMLDTLSDQHLCYDAFLEMSVDTRNTVYIATANSLQNIPNYLVNRFEVIKVDDYDFDDKINIAKQFIIPKMLTSYGISKHELVFENEAISEIVKSYCDDEGVRKTSDNIKTIIRKVLCDWDVDGIRERVTIDTAFVNKSLDVYINDSDPKIRFNRNRDRYCTPILNETLLTLDNLRNSKLDAHQKEVNNKRLEYLTSLIPGPKQYTGFNLETFFASMNSTHYGLNTLKETIAKRFYTKSLRKESFAGEKFLLVGGPGIGKSSICSSIALALGMPLVKISLNGVSDDNSIKGFDQTYIGSDSGLIIKGLARVKGTRVVMQLDEIDKVGQKSGVDVSHSLIDLLDESAMFMDRFLGVPIDLSEVLFIATANNLSDVHPLLVDRFVVINLDGYSVNDKEHIISNYLLPKFENLYSSSEFKFKITAEARRLLVSDYCYSFGVRDIEKAVEQIITDKLFTVKDPTNTKIFIIESKDIRASLGVKPMTRGNIPERSRPGISRALSVTSSNVGMTFAIETLVISDDPTLHITGLPRESTIDSVKIARSYIKSHYTDLLKNRGMHIHFGEGAVIKDGPSAGVAIVVSMASAIFNTTVAGDFAYTGEIDLFGNVFPVGGIKEKIFAAEKSGCSCVFIPNENYKQLEQKELDRFSIKILPISHVSEALNMVLPNIQSWELEQTETNAEALRYSHSSN